MHVLNVEMKLGSRLQFRTNAAMRTGWEGIEIGAKADLNSYRSSGPRIFAAGGCLALGRKALHEVADL